MRKLEHREAESLPKVVHGGTRILAFQLLSLGSQPLWVSCLFRLSRVTGHGPASWPAGGLRLPGRGACRAGDGVWAGAGAGGGGPDDG